MRDRTGQQPAFVISLINVTVQHALQARVGETGVTGGGTGKRVSRLLDRCVLRIEFLSGLQFNLPPPPDRNISLPIPITLRPDHHAVTIHGKSMPSDHDSMSPDNHRFLSFFHFFASRSIFFACHRRQNSGATMPAQLFH